MRKLIFIGLLLCPSWINARSIDATSVSNEQSVAECLAQYAFPTNDADVFAELDSGMFSQRSAVVLKLIQCDFISTDTNAFLAVGGYLSSGMPLSMGDYHNDIVAVHRQDRFNEFGDSNYVVRAGSGYFGPLARACRQRYDFRSAYNSKLARFRMMALRDAKDELARPRWQIYTEEQRTALLNEFYRRACVTDEERGKL